MPQSKSFSSSSRRACHLLHSISAPHASQIPDRRHHRVPLSAMKNSSLHGLALLLAAMPLAGAWSSLSCGGGTYAANSTYEANLRCLAAVLPAETSASPSRYVDRSIGYWPNRLRAVSSCRSGDDGNCTACIAEAFERVKLQCAFRKEASFFSRDCSLRLDQVHIIERNLFLGSDLFGGGTETQILVLGMLFQAIGLVCLFLMLLRAWRHDTKKGATPLVHPETSKSAA